MIDVIEDVRNKFKENLQINLKILKSPSRELIRELDFR